MMLVQLFSWIRWASVSTTWKALSISSEAQKAVASGLVPTPPGDQRLKEKNKLMVDADTETYIIKLDASGKPTGEIVDGNLGREYP
jgi:hypothetical protein